MIPDIILHNNKKNKLTKRNPAEIMTGISPRNVFDSIKVKKTCLLYKVSIKIKGITKNNIPIHCFKNK